MCSTVGGVGVAVRVSKFPKAKISREDVNESSGGG